MTRLLSSFLFKKEYDLNKRASDSNRSESEAQRLKNGCSSPDKKDLQGRSLVSNPGSKPGLGPKIIASSSQDNKYPKVQLLTPSIKESGYGIILQSLSSNHEDQIYRLSSRKSPTN